MILINVVTTPGESKNDLLYRCKNGLTLPCSVFTSSTYFIYDSFFLEGKRQFSSSRGAPLLLAVRRAMTFSAVPLISGILLTFFLITNAYPDILLLEKYQGRSSLTAAGIIKEAMNASWISSFTLLIFQFFYWISSNLLALFERPPDHFFQSFKVFVKPLCQDHTHAQQFNEDCRGSRTARNKMAKQRQVKETVRLSGEFLVRSLVTDIVLMVVVFLVWSSSAFVFSLFNMYNHAVMMLLTTALCLLGLLTMHYQSRPSRRSVFRH